MAVSITERRAGVVVPLGALRGNESIGVGEFPDLADFAAFCVKARLSLIQLLPVNDTGFDSSPYSSLSAFALNPLYIRIGCIPEAGPFKAKITALGKKFEKDERFNYYEITKAKLDLCREVFDSNLDNIVESSGARGKLGAWIAAHPWVKTYAVYRRLKEANGQASWKDWKEAKIGVKDIEKLWTDKALFADHIFWVWLQKIADEQFADAAKRVSAAGILLEGDIPILMNEDSADVWERPDIFNRELSAGAPPDMYSPEGQNWGFPTYNWANQEKDGYDWWKRRLKTASQYYGAYRIDHVLGFFRIWASNRNDNGAALGRYIPWTPVKTADLNKLGFDEGRCRWLSRPHIPSGEVWEACGGRADEAGRVFEAALTRIGGEELWLFRNEVQGEKDIAALVEKHGLSGDAAGFLFRMWRNRLFYEYKRGEFFPTWKYRETRAWASLSDDERNRLEELISRKNADSEKLWEKEGEKLLKALTSSTEMLPCAEDLGAVPDCVPRTLSSLGILGLRVVRWTRRWDEAGQPYIPLADYPEMSVCTPSVHDSSTLREWWDKEAEQGVFSALLGIPSLPRIYNPGTARDILRHLAGAASRFRVFQIQDLLHLSSRWYARDSAAERINVPGTCNSFNWTWRLPSTIDEIAGDAELIEAIQGLAAVQPAARSAEMK